MERGRPHGELEPHPSRRRLLSRLVAGHPQRRRRRELEHRLRQVYGADTNLNPIRVNQRALDEAVRVFEAASIEAEEVPDAERWRSTMVGMLPHEAIRYADERRAEVFNMTSRLIQLGIADRAVKVEEAKASLLAQAVRDAARDAGLTNKQVAALGAALRARLEGAEASVAPPKQIDPPQRMAEKVGVAA
jgi:hypothetical protein